MDQDRQHFLTARAYAIEAYALLEMELTYLLAGLLNITPNVASLIFFQITAARARNAILQNLIEEVHASKYSAYWNGQRGNPNKQRLPGLFTHINNIDEKRNHIVHWHSGSITIPDKTTYHALQPPFHWFRGKATGPIKTADIVKFSAKTHFVRASVNRFRRFTRRPDLHPLSAAEQQTWTHIFQQPPIYPPPNTHPLSPSYKAP